MLERIREVLKGIEGLLAVLVLVAGIAGGAALLIYQLYIWLRLGQWESYNLVTLFQWTGSPWASNPSDWKGIHKLLSIIPLFVAIPVIAALLWAMLQSDAQSTERTKTGQ